jgi:hypothetical protein
MRAERYNSSSRTSSRVRCVVAIFTKCRPAAVLLGPAFENGLVDCWRRCGGWNSNQRRQKWWNRYNKFGVVGQEIEICNFDLFF